MRQLTKGEGEPRFTLYAPFWTPHNSLFTLVALSPHLRNALGAHRAIDTIEGRGKSILRIQGFVAYGEAKTAFERVRSIAHLLSLESSTAIAIEGELSDPQPLLSGLPKGWKFEGSTWEPDPETGVVSIDGVANILIPTIVPEHKRIIDLGGMNGQIVRQVPPETLKATIDNVFSRPPVQLSHSDEFAMQAYMNACSQENTKLRFLSLVACLEVMSQPVKGQSSRKSIRNLIEKHSALIASSLPRDHPHVLAPNDAVDLAYNIRNKLAHEGRWDQFSPNEVHRSMQFLTSATRVLLRKVLQA